MQTYVVRPGDTLWGIASRFGVNVQTLMQANGLRDPNSIYVGQTLQIPVSGPGHSPYPPPYPPLPFPPIPGLPGGQLENRVSRLEREYERLNREVNRIDQRVDRLEHRVTRLER